ncbi:hypothetical protein GCM10010377_67120 [Streptomyces viridiviolaceus]|uniref:Uncharacterized protein n=1 Tax=Streptomyces viridiviolaceus TaxID=68282 RepID=A0ABW2EDD0_9ACTN|nr:hypothetical protein [Streptomyces viridiviolaceus]GHB66811.1 hypothetical protein GCM10010377_67120 [Streptomyces viridiviolaceus]
MFAYELQRYRSDDLLRRAERARLAREAVLARRAERRAAARSTAETESHTSRFRRHRFARAA